MPGPETIYLDYNATTPCDPRVVEAMLPYFTQDFGNTMSMNHAHGWAADRGAEKARSQIAQLIGAEAKEITFTSGATESNNAAIEGLIETIRREEGAAAPIHFLISPVEHNSVRQAAEHAARVHNVELEWLAIDSLGRVIVDQIEAKIRPHTRLLAAMWVQNELGSINPVAAIGEICRRHQVYFLCDATQAIGKIPVNLREVHVDLLSFSAHKLYGPKGVGFLYLRSRAPHVEIAPLLNGGGHERGLRSGTLNVPGIVGMGFACEIARAEMSTESARLRQLRDQLWTGLQKTFPGVRRNGDPDGISHLLNVTFPMKLPASLRGLSVSQGSACLSGKTTTSFVLKAVGLSDDEAARTLRLTVGRPTQPADIDETLRLLAEQLAPQKSKNPGLLTI